ncbi:uncharacterized protein N7496_005688, partial [Penicillium cataractarum]
KNWILFELNLERVFLGWWEKSEYGHKLNRDADVDLGRPRVLCKACLTLLDHPQYKGNGTSAMRKKRGSHQTLISDSLQNHSIRELPNIDKEQLLKTITCLRLPFQTVENPVFQRLLNLVYSGPKVLELPSAKTLRRRLRDVVTVQQESQLRDLPNNAKQAFIAITVYFIDKDWNYREMLLSFEPLHGPHTGSNLSDVLHQLLKERGLLDRIFSVTTDNATNNKTLIRALQEKLISASVISSRESIIRVPWHIKVAPKNKEVKTFWSDTQAIGLRDLANHGNIAYTLAKVSLKFLWTMEIQKNSTFLILRRARRLRNIIDKYCSDHKYSQFKITDVK